MRFTGIQFICIVIILILIATLVFHNYFSLDEPNLLWAIRNGTGWAWYYKKFIPDGRPLYGLILISATEFLGTLENLKYMRITAVIFAFLFCLILFRFLKKNGVNENVCFIIALMIFSLPGISVFISWAECFLMFLSAMLSFFAGMLITRVFSKYLEIPSSLNKNKENGYILLAISLQVISLFNYQGMALAFLLPGFFLLILHSHVPNRSRIIFFISISTIFFISLALYYKLFKSMLTSMHTEIVGRGKIGSDPFGKIVWFSKILIEAGKLHFLLIKNVAIQNILSIIFAALIVRDIIRKKFLDLLFLIFFSAFLFLPHLIIGESWGASRNFTLISVIITFYLVIRGFEILPAPAFRWVAISAILCISIMCLNIYEGWTKPMQKDYNYLKNFVQKLPLLTNDSDAIQIQVLLPGIKMHDKISIIKQYYDEFNAPVFYRVWPIEPALKILYQDRYPDITAERINKLVNITIVDDLKSLPAVHQTKNFELNLNYQ